MQWPQSIVDAPWDDFRVSVVYTPEKLRRRQRMLSEAAGIHRAGSAFCTTFPVFHLKALALDPVADTE